VDLNRPVTYRGLDLTKMELGPTGRNLRGYSILHVDFSDVEGEGYREKRAFDDGYDAGNVYLGFRNVRISGTVYGESLGDLWDRMQKLRSRFTPTLAFAEAPGDYGFMPLDYEQKTLLTGDWPGGVMPLRMYLRPMRQPQFTVSADRLSGKDANGWSMEWSVLCWARDPRIYVKDAQSIPMSGTAGGGATSFLINRGDYPAPLNFELLVAANGPVRVFDYTGGGSGFKVTIPVSANQRLVRVDSVLKVVTLQELNTETLRMDLIVFDQGLTWPRVRTTIPYETYSWTCTGSPGLAAGSRSFHHEAYA
jgi:hypothetical protein